MGRHNAQCLREYRRRRKRKKRILAKEGVLRWNRVCNVVADNTSTDGDGTDSTVDSTDSTDSTEYGRLCQNRCNDAPGHVDLRKTQTEAESYAPEHKIIFGSDEHKSDSAEPERDTDSLVESMYRYTRGSDSSVSIRERDPSPSLTPQKCKQSRLFSTDPLYVKMLQYQLYSRRLQTFKAKALQNLEKPHH